MTIHNRINGNAILFIVCDGDGTLINYPGSPAKSSWDLVGHLYCDRKGWQQVADRYSSRIKATQDSEEQERIFLEWARADAEALKGHDPELIKSQQIPYSPGVREYFSEANGEQRAILSGGIDLVLARAADELGFQHRFMNSFGVSEGRFDGTVNITVTLHNKRALLSKLLEMTGVSPRNVLAIGDGFNDIPVLDYVKQAGGLSIAMDTTDPDVINAAHATINDFREIEKHTYRK